MPRGIVRPIIGSEIGVGGEVNGHVGLFPRGECTGGTSAA